LKFLRKKLIREKGKIELIELLKLCLIRTGMRYGQDIIMNVVFVGQPRNRTDKKGIVLLVGRWFVIGDKGISLESIFVDITKKRRKKIIEYLRKIFDICDWMC